MVELKGITYKELSDKYGDFREETKHNVSGYVMCVNVSPDIRIESVHSFYIRKSMYTKYHITRFCSPEQELFWKIIPKTVSKELKKEVMQVRDSFYANKTAGELIAIANLSKEC